MVTRRQFLGTSAAAIAGLATRRAWAQGPVVRYWLSPYDVTDHGGFMAATPPEGWLGAIDLRSYAQCAANQPGDGFAFVAMPDGARVDAAAIDLGTDLNEVLAPRDRTTIQDALGLPAALSATTPADIVYEVLTVQADPTGDDRCKPLVPSKHGRYTINLAGEKIVDKPFIIEGPEAAVFQDMLRRQYRETRERSIAEDSEHFRKVLGGWMEKYELPREWFQPADLRNDTELKPETTITDNFNRADADPLSDGSFTWTVGGIKLLSNQVVATGAGGTARGESDLSSDDHYTQLTQVGAANAHNYVGPIARFAAAADTGYVLAIRSTTSTSAIYKVVAGSFTSIAAPSNDETAGLVLKIEANDSTITGYKDAVSVGAPTDSAITGNTRTGFRTLLAGGMPVTADDFSASDLSAPPAGAVDITGRMSPGATTFDPIPRG